LVDRNGLFVTNYHVIKNAHTAYVVLADETKLLVMGVAALDKKADLAILKVAEKLVAQPLELAGPEVPPVGTKVFAIGNPRGLANTMSDGMVSGHREPDAIADFLKIALIQTTAPTSPGSSGGPLLAANGKVVGVTTGSRIDGQNLNFAIPVSHVARLLARCESEGQLTQFPLNRQPDVLACIERGVAWMKEKEYDKAIEDFDEAIRLDPSNARAHGCRGCARVNKKEYGTALRDLNEAIRLDPENARAYDNRGQVYGEMKNWDLAIQDFDEAIRLDPKCSPAYSNRGRVWGEKKRYDKSIEDFDEAIRLDPKRAMAYSNRAAAWLAIAEYDKAINDCDEAIRLDPKLALAYHNRGRAWMNKHDHTKAWRDSSMARQLDPGQFPR
jgi:Tfp pilus assembly protein PilF